MSSHKPRKRFGQNFLHDPQVIARIIAAVNPQPSDHLVEVGPGQGAITVELLKAAGKLDAVELDRDLIEPLQAKCAGFGEFTVHQGDALKFDFCSLASDGRPLRLVGNLPYNISTPLLFHFLDQAACITDMHFMLQKEVVERMAAGPGSKTYGRLSVMLQTRCSVTPLFDIGPGAFNPPPKVDSAIVRLVPHSAPPFAIDDPALFERIVAQAFAQRRKTLRKSLQRLVPAAAFEQAGIDPAERPEQLAPADFARLSNAAKSAPSTT
jgi:16S rRNA (adenine1518-N6/adenine1519-N6)-dimethyltransferase